MAAVSALRLVSSRIASCCRLVSNCESKSTRSCRSSCKFWRRVLTCCCADASDVLYPCMTPATTSEFACAAARRARMTCATCPNLTWALRIAKTTSCCRRSLTSSILPSSVLRWTASCTRSSSSAASTSSRAFRATLKTSRGPLDKAGPGPGPGTLPTPGRALAMYVDICASEVRNRRSSRCCACVCATDWARAIVAGMGRLPRGREGVLRSFSRTTCNFWDIM